MMYPVVQVQANKTFQNVLNGLLIEYFISKLYIM